MEVWESVVVGAGQAGLATSYFLRQRGIDHVVLDANPAPGGAWQHRWDSLGMDDVHGVADLPGSQAPAPSARAANVVVPAYFGDYEHAHSRPPDRTTSRSPSLSTRSTRTGRTTGSEWACS